MDAPIKTNVGLNPLVQILIPDRSRPLKTKLFEEDQIILEFTDWLRIKSLEPDKQFPYIWFHVSNENPLFQRKGYLNKKRWLGLVPGAPDFVLIAQNKVWLMEFKTPTGYLSPNQKIFQQWCAQKGILYVVCRSAHEAITLLES